MIIRKTLPLKAIYEFSGHHIAWLTGWMSLVTAMYYFTHWQIMVFPWLPLALIGTAVAFYVGFKNNHSYERLWEARKIWSSISNNSRKLATMLKNYRSDDVSIDPGEAVRKEMIFRHIAYIYLLREQLLEPTQWEHVSLHNLWRVGYYNRRRRELLNVRFKAELEEVAKRKYLPEQEWRCLQRSDNRAAQLLDMQSRMIQQLYEDKALNMIQQVEIQHAINSFYDDQGSVECIKKTPFPRKYASFSFVFVCIFIFLLPFGIVGEFSKLGDAAMWLSIPVGVVVGWVYVVMEMIGDYSENPFEGLHNDTPMLAICRDIEIDMLQMIGEDDAPDPIQPKGYVLL